jgi:hypothetical protein
MIGETRYQLVFTDPFWPSLGLLLFSATRQILAEDPIDHGANDLGRLDVGGLAPVLTAIDQTDEPLARVL